MNRLSRLVLFMLESNQLISTIIAVELVGTYRRRRPVVRWHFFDWFIFFN
jgi:hypothetical protein